MCAGCARSAGLGHVGAAAGHDLDKALIGEHPDGFASGQPRDLVPLHELSLGRHWPPWRDLARLDRLAQDRRYLLVDRRLALMIDRHLLDVTQVARTPDCAIGP